MADKKEIPIPKITISKAIQVWEADPKNEGKKLSDEEDVDLIFRAIENLDTSINTLVNCKKLSLSSNLINRIPELNLPKLVILSLGRNKIKKISGLSFVSATLQQLWISYNEITSLEGLRECTKLQVLYIGNNLISSYNELNVLTPLTELSDVVFKNNPFMLESDNLLKPMEKDYKETAPEIKKRIPSLKLLDGEYMTELMKSDEAQA